MDIYKNDDTGIKTAQGRPCNTFSFDLSIKSHAQTLSFEIWLYEVEQDAMDNKTPNNIRAVTFPITNQTTFEDCVASLFEGSPYTIGEETLNLSNAEVIGQYPAS